ncbi:hypothetical protein G9A89_004474 [Geosiphon pyriformis]|nr:hypothetical protein G9A89_004474 [Geosiphon pyriformis]
MQSILNTASSFFRMVDIEINLDKTETIVVRLSKKKADGKNETVLNIIESDIEAVCGVIRKKHITEKQAKSKITDLLVRLNSNDIAGMTTKIRLANLQAQRWSAYSILEYSTNEQSKPGVNLIANIMQIMNERGILFKSSGNTYGVPEFFFFVNVDVRKGIDPSKLLIDQSFT